MHALAGPTFQTSQHLTEMKQLCPWQFKSQTQTIQHVKDSPVNCYHTMNQTQIIEPFIKIKNALCPMPNTVF